MHQGNNPRTRAIGIIVLATILCGSSLAAETASKQAAGPILEPAVWQGPEMAAQKIPGGANASGTSNSTNSSSGASSNPLRVALQPTPPIPPQTLNLPAAGTTVPGAETHTLTTPSAPIESTLAQPLLDGNSPAEELMPPVVESECYEGGERQGVRPYGGGHADDWSWGCGGSPYRNGPGMCDNYKVGPRWHFTFDGLVMSRDETDLEMLAATINQNSLGAPIDDFATLGPTDPLLEQFDHAPGGRITVTSQVPRCVGYQIQGAYEGIENWDAAVVFPKISPIPGTTIANSSEQRSLHYTSSYHSGEISWVRSVDENWHPFCGVRYINVGERLNDFLDQQAPPPLPVDGGNLPTAINPIGPITTMDRRNLIDIDNNLMGFQVGMLHEAWCISRRFTIEGFVNAGVYYNNINYFNRMSTTTTQVFADDLSTTVNESRTDVVRSVNNDKSDLSEISYVTEASLSGVCRLNKCWALRGGYQILWIDNVHLADAAFLGNSNSNDDLFFQGWHAGVECRR